MSHCIAVLPLPLLHCYFQKETIYKTLQEYRNNTYFVNSSFSYLTWRPSNAVPDLCFPFVLCNINVLIIYFIVQILRCWAVQMELQSSKVIWFIFLFQTTHTQTPK